MNCPHCDQLVETGAVFCGNCGTPLQPTTLAVATAGPPTYALATAGQHNGEIRSLLSLILGVAGIIGALFMALIGLALGLAGIVMGTLSRSDSKRRLNTVGIIMSGLAVITSLAVWAYAYKHDTNYNGKVSAAQTLNNAPTVLASDFSTPCYVVNFVDRLNVSNHSGSCNIQAYNADTIEGSTDAYKVYADTSAVTDASAFTALAKQAIDKDVKNSLSGFKVETERVTAFAGSPAYAVIAADKSHNVALVEEAVFHKTANGDNIFILVHAISGKTADLTTLETQWQWK